MDKLFYYLLKFEYQAYETKTENKTNKDNKLILSNIARLVF